MRFVGTIDELRGDAEAALPVRVKDGRTGSRTALAAAGHATRRDGEELSLLLPRRRRPSWCSRRRGRRGQVRHLAPLERSLEAAFLRAVTASRA